MLALISPAKKLDFESEWTGHKHSEPQLLSRSKELADILKGYSTSEIKSLMKLSDKLAELNHARYQNFSTPFTAANARPAAFAFKGDTYVGLEAETLSAEDIEFAQTRLGIISGLYGLLRPLDLMQAYRLEMGTKLTNPNGEDLYDYWGDTITEACNMMSSANDNRVVINLASNEYIKAIKKDKLAGGMITCHFKEIKDGKAKVIGLFAKRARGMMARYMIQNRLTKPEELKAFDVDGYSFDKSESDDKNLVFIRG